MKFKLLAFFLLLPLLTSCVDSKIIDDLTLVTAAGIDLKDDNEDVVEFITISPKFSSENDIQDSPQMITVPIEANFIDHLDKQSSRPVLVGDMDVFIIGKKYAKNGIFPIIDSFQRNPNIGSRLYLVITEDSLLDTMTGHYGSKGNSIYMTNLLDHNIKLRDLPKTNIQLFASDFFRSDLDAFLPVLKIVNGDSESEKLKVSGIGVFHNEKLSYILPADQLFTFKFLVDQHTNGSVSIPIGNHHTIINSIQSKMKLNTDLINKKVTVSFKSNGIIEGYTGPKVDDKTLERIKTAFNEYLVDESLQILKKFQELSLDPIGLQKKFSQQHRKFNKDDWDDLYEDLTFEASSETVIVESGTLE